MNHDYNGVIMDNEILIDMSPQHVGNVFGHYDKNVKLIEKVLNVDIVQRGDGIKITGKKDATLEAEKILNELLTLSQRGNDITEQNVEYALSINKDALNNHSLLRIDEDIICRTINGKPVKPKTLGQKKYVDAIRDHMLVFGSGPAGTGKTYLAIAMAVTAFQKEEVEKIILTRPAIEAGEKLGFLPGDLQSKIDPYLRPLYDALYQIMGPENFQKNMERDRIEVAPLAYMRGRTLENAFIILDEAQNTTPAQMKMFLTRIGFGSKVVVTGDRSQKDLAPGVTSGLDVAEKVLKKIKDIAFIKLDGKDVVRHPLVQKIVEAYEDYEKKQTKPKKETKPIRK
jgi:phosphate starvation-inducible PhoH-like protein